MGYTTGLALPHLGYTASHAALLLWMGMNSPSYSMLEITLGTFTYAFVCGPRMVLSWDKVASLVCSNVPASARRGRLTALKLLMDCSILLHNYVHCNLWALSYKLSAFYGYKQAGFLMFLPFLLYEAGSLLFLVKKAA